VFIGVIVDVFNNNDEGAYEDNNTCFQEITDCPTVVTISATDNTATEAGQNTGTFTVSRTGSTAYALTVYYTIGGSATNGTDYIALPGSVTIPAGASSAPISVTPLNDTVCESDETVTLGISANPAYTVGSPYNATVTITDNDCANAPVQLFVNIWSDGSISPAGDVDWYFFTVTIPGTYTILTWPGMLADTYMYLYGPDNQTILIEEDDNGGGIFNAMIVRSLDVGTYYIKIRASSSSATGSYSIVVQHSLGNTVTISATDSTAAEAGQNTGTFTVSRTGSTAYALPVSFGIHGSATNGIDYEQIYDDLGHVIIPAGASSAPISVTPLNDTVCEDNETVIVDIAPEWLYTIGSPSSATVTITDDDCVPVGLQVNREPVQGNISPAGDVDWYSFTVTTPGRYVISTFPTNSTMGTLEDTYMYLYGPNNQTILIEENDNNGEYWSASIDRYFGIGTYYVKIRASSSSATGMYSIHVFEWGV
jgi:hypothetical protein